MKIINTKKLPRPCPRCGTEIQGMKCPKCGWTSRNGDTPS